MLGSSPIVLLTLLSVVAAILHTKGPPAAGIRGPKSEASASLQRRYLAAYLVMSAADWMQGSYVYAVYDEFGYSMSDIAILYVADFASALLIGTFVASLSDRWGRRRGSLVYGLVYILSCLVYHRPSFAILMLGCLLDGIANSLLNSSFESWLVHEHQRLSLPEQDLQDIFAAATFYNGVVAIAAGLVSGFVAEFGGSVATFDAAIVLLLVGMLVIFSTWPENYGGSEKLFSENLRSALSSAISDERVLILGMIESLFEAVLFTFVFLFTPALGFASDTSHATAVADPKYALGIVFACFMVSIMIGSRLFSLSYRFLKVSAEDFLAATLVLAASSFVIPIGTSLYLHANSSATALLNMLGFCVFEVCCGAYYPVMATLRSKYIPDEMHASVMVCLRLPLNILLIVMLLLASSAPMAFSFAVCAAALFASAVLGRKLSALSERYRIPKA